MSIAELKELRKGVKLHIDNADEKVVKMMYAMLEVSEENENSLLHLTSEQEAELDRRIELDEKGLMEYSSWEDVKARILSRK